MPIIESTVGENGEAINTPRPWTEETLLAWIASERETREAGGIFVGDRYISTLLADQPKIIELARHAERVLAGDATATAELALFGGVYWWRPLGAVWCYSLTAAEVQRIAKCANYFLTHCQAVEGNLQQMIKAKAMPLDAIATQAETLWHDGRFTP